jgi:hypothetical protein
VSKKSRGKGGRREDNLFAWRGISVNLPRGWSPGMIQDKTRSGYVRIEDREAVRMELKWNKMKAGFSTSVDKTVQEAARSASKAGEEIEVKRELPWNVPREMGGEFFSIGGDWNTYYLLATRGDLGVYLRVMGEPGEDLTGTARETLESLRVSAGSRMRWAVFGLDAYLPVDYEIEKHSLVTGHISMRFRNGANLLVLDRYSLADIALGDKTVERWLTVKHHKMLDNYRTESETVQAKGHEAARITGTKKLRLSMLRKPKFINMTGWVCDKLNRMFVATLEHNGDNDIPQVIKGITCH